MRDLAKNTMTAELLQPDELVSGLMSQVCGCVCTASCGDNGTL